MNTPTNPTLAQAQQMKRDLEAGILALIQQFERNTGVRAVGLASEAAEVTRFDSERREWRTVAVRVSVVL